MGKIIPKRNIAVSTVAVVSGWRDHRCFSLIHVCYTVCRVGGIVVSVAAFQAVNPGVRFLANTVFSVLEAESKVDEPE